MSSTTLCRVRDKAACDKNTGSADGRIKDSVVRSTPAQLPPLFQRGEPQIEVVTQKLAACQSWASSWPFSPACR